MPPPNAMVPFVLMPSSEGRSGLLWIGVLSDSTTTPCSWLGLVGMSLSLSDFDPVAFFPGSIASRLSAVVVDWGCKIDNVEDIAEELS